MPGRWSAYSSKLRLGLTLLAPFCTASLALAIGMTNIPQSARALQSTLPANNSLTASEIQSTADITAYVHLPIVMRGGCAPIPGETYGTLAPTNPRTDNVEEDHLINLARRGYEPVDKFKGLIDNGPAGDPLAPQFPGLFSDNRTGIFDNVYALHRWEQACNCPSSELVTNPEVTVAGLATAPGETIHVPDSGYDIGDGNDVMVLYAGETRLTLKYTREDDIVQGYTLYLENVCV